MEKYSASCHCGAVKVTFESEPITEGLECNCSHCSKKGFILTFLPTEQITLHSGDDNQIEYLFNKKTITHLFCKTCGVEVYTRSNMNGKEMSAVNLRTVDDLDIDSLAIKKFNGKEY